MIASVAGFVAFRYFDSSNFDILHSDILFWISRCQQQVRNWRSVKSEMFTPQRPSRVLIKGAIGLTSPFYSITFCYTKL